MREITAVSALSFTIQPGEIVGFIGHNGAGKTTTLKMLTGLLNPSQGNCRVLNHTPFQRNRHFLRQISLIMGQRHQLAWDIPALDSFAIYKAIYALPTDSYQQTLAALTDMLELAPLLNRPVRNLSLGERMRCEIAAALLHNPQILFLDEPTIGLDQATQRRLWEFIRSYNSQFQTTILLTSHNMADIAALCKRVLVLENGRLTYDGLYAKLEANQS